MLARLAELPMQIDADVAVVGAGAAGLAVALGLERSKRRVLVVESGADELNVAAVVGKAHWGVSGGRARGIGGTTRIWTGQCLRLRPEDVVSWPIGFAELTRYYPRAETLLGVPQGIIDAREEWRRAGIGPTPDLGSDVDLVASSFAPRRNLGRRFRERLARASAVTVVEDATALRVRLDLAGRRATGLELGSLDGRRSHVAADVVVLAAGGIENARLLLLSGLANDNVGRWFHDHPVGMRVAEVRTTDPGRLQDRFGIFVRRRRRTHVKLAASPVLERRAGIPSCSATLAFDGGDRSPYDALLRLRRRILHTEPVRGVTDDLRALAASPPFIAQTVYRRFVRGLGPAVPSPAISLLCVAEQRADGGRRIALGEELDALGQPVTRIEWHVGDEVRAAMRETVVAVGEALRRAGLGIAEPAGWLERDGWRDEIFDTGHPMGATRMSASAADGVVDGDCRVHGLDNLFVAGSSVFPSAGYANPTLTIVALALRIADRLRAAE